MERSPRKDQSRRVRQGGGRWQQACLKTDDRNSFNTFSIYNHWGYHNPSEGVLDFDTGAHNFTTIMTLAKEVGLYMIVRPGPYVNAEANAGGYPLWLTTGEYGNLRTDDPKYTAAWKPYWKRVSEIVKPHLVTNGGNVIMYQVVSASSRIKEHKSDRPCRLRTSSATSGRILRKRHSMSPKRTI